MEKLYVSQWLKVGKELPNRVDSMAARQAALANLGGEELTLLFQLVKQGDNAVKDYDEEEMLRMLHEVFRPGKVVHMLIERKDNTWLRKYLSLTFGRDSAQISNLQYRRGIAYLVESKDYDNLLLLGRFIVMFREPMLDEYVDLILGMMKEYKYGEGGPANPVSCLIAMGPKVTQKVGKFLKDSDLPDAMKRWKEFNNKLGV